MLSNLYRFLKSFSTFAFTLSSILMSGGQARLKPSPGIFFVASMPSLLPMAISLVAWSRTSAGPLVKMLSRCGSVHAQRRKRTSLVLCTSTSASTRRRNCPAKDLNVPGRQSLRWMKRSRRRWRGFSTCSRNSPTSCVALWICPNYW